MPFGHQHKQENALFKCPLDTFSPLPLIQLNRQGRVWRMREKKKDPLRKKKFFFPKRMYYLYQNNNNVNNKLLPYLVNITGILGILMTISDILLNCSNRLWK